MRYIINLSYDGTSLSGWQKQNNAVTVQEELSNALQTLLGTPCEVVGAGRTDAGVHAIGYVAHFDAPEALEAEKISYKLNAILPFQIVVHSIAEVSEGFHARFSAVERKYNYFLHRRKDPFCDKYSYYCRYPLDVEKMNRAAKLLLGTHDFSCFEKKGSDNPTSICTITCAKWETYSPDHCRIMCFPHSEGDYLVFTISANRFLRNMVRAIVGTLVDVGRGRHEPEWVLSLMESKDRCAAGESVPGKALFLSRVSYPCGE